MSKKTTRRSGQARDGSRGHHDPMSKVTARLTSTQPSVLSFVSWIDPPIGVNMNGIDAYTLNYKVSIMIAQSTTGQQEIPFAEPITWNPMVPPPSILLVQYQLMSGLPGDPIGNEYYETMILQQPTAPSLFVRSRVFMPPQTSQFSGVKLGTATNVGIVQVTGVIDSTNQAINVYYQHFTVTDPSGFDPTGTPADLFLQHPW
jgi:hypothetical protein